MEFITIEQQLTDVVYKYCGTDNLRKEMEKRKVNYVKIVKPCSVTYVLRGAMLKTKVIIKL